MAKDDYNLLNNRLITCMKRRLLILSILCFTCIKGGIPVGAAGFTPGEDPFMLRAREEAAAIRKLIETGHRAGAHYEGLLKEKGPMQTFCNLIWYEEAL